MLGNLPLVRERDRRIEGAKPERDRKSVEGKIGDSSTCELLGTFINIFINKIVLCKF